MSDFDRMVERATGDFLHGSGIDVFQVNVGLRCNQACVHCHLNCSPTREEVMGRPTMKRVIAVAEKARPGLVDITGGAPELNPHLREFVSALGEKGFKVQVRTNLTALLEEGMEDMPSFYRDQGVGLVASLPCYLEENVDAQRGAGVYEKSIEAIRRLNSHGYGVDDDAVLNLVYNPGGAFLPPDQEGLEQDYKRQLHERFGVSFTNLLTITNMPLGRFLEKLRGEGKEEEYMNLLVESFNEQTIDGLMCRHQVSVGWDGQMYDCDFNLALGYPIDHGAPHQIEKFDSGIMGTRRIVTGRHCFGCTAGCGSSCGGALI